MKKYVLIISTLLLFTSSYACDICGSGVGGYYIGILPEFNKRFFGLRYQHAQLRTSMDIYGHVTPLTDDESYSSVEFWAAHNIGDRWRIMAVLPYSFMERTNLASGDYSSRNGFSDALINGYFNLLNRQSAKNGKLWVHSLWIGAGVKLPTGNYDPAEAQHSFSPNMFQLGTGSTDVLLNAMYDLRIQDFGINTNATYRVNNTNSDRYRYGNKFAINATTYYKIALGTNSRLAPNAGIAFESQDNDILNGYRTDQTGGRMLSLLGGIELNVGMFATGIAYHQPVSQHLGNGRNKSRHRALAHISYAF